MDKPKGKTLEPNNITEGFNQFKDLDEFCKFVKHLTEDEDDEFFHLTCHVEPSLKTKIEVGQYVDLERLLPKSRAQVLNEEQKMQMVNKNRFTYWIPADKDTKIGGILRWDQAFRVYAAIYCKANPHGSALVWQYINVINSAAAAYVWENVAYYDFTFRQMIGERPNCSWSKIYNQLWNLAMCEPLTKQNYSNMTGFDKRQNSGYSNTSNNGSKHGDWHDRCC